jgi:mannose-binding lectin 1
MINDGTKSYDHQRDGSSQIQGSCIRDFRNKPLPIRLKIEYINGALTVRNQNKRRFTFFFHQNFLLLFQIYINNGISQDDNAFEFCTRVERADLPKSGYFGVTAATGGLADDHDVLEFLTHTYADKQASAQNQGATDEQTKKYKEEYAKYEEELKKDQAEYVVRLFLF